MISNRSHRQKKKAKDSLHYRRLIRPQVAAGILEVTDERYTLDGSL